MPDNNDKYFAQNDATIKKLIDEFNKDKAGFVDATKDQVSKIGDLSTDLVKAWFIQESGGSPQAYKADPAQVNVPGDWSDYKSGIGLKKPQARNEGTPEGNIKAAIIWLARKGFGTSGQPPKNNPSGTFDGWDVALQRYNGRTELTSNGKPYRDNYASQIATRAADMTKWTPIELPQPTPKPTPAVK